MPQIRLPEPKDLEEILSGVSKRSEMAERKLKKAMDTAWTSMDIAGKDNLLKALSLTRNQIETLLARAAKWSDAERKQITTVIEKMRDLNASGLAVYPKMSLSATREPTAGEKKIITDLFNAVSAEMRRIGQGHETPYVEAVFGLTHVKDAEAMFKASADALDRLSRNNSIVIDNLRKDQVWQCGGLTNQEQMALPQSVLADPNAYKDKTSDAYLAVAHEASHAAKPTNTSDAKYEHHEDFKLAQPQEKVTSADYYKVVVRQIATGKKEEFMPRSVAPPSSKRSTELTNAAVQADKIANAAWVSAIRIHDFLRDLANNPKKAQTYSAWCRNASRLMGLTLHRSLWVTTTAYLGVSGTPTASFVGSPQTSTEYLGAAKTTTDEKSAPFQITGLDLSIADNKIAMLSAINGKGGFILVEPTRKPTTPDEYVDHVIRQMLMDFLPRKNGYTFTKSLDKDVIVIRSLANLHESVAGKNLILEILKVSLPEPMKTYETKVWT